MAAGTGAALVPASQEFGMRKLSKLRASRLDPHTVESDMLDTRPRGLSGATITSWPRPLDIDFNTLFARGSTGATVTGAQPEHAQPENPAAPIDAPVIYPTQATVSLSDGTKISFATAGQFDTVELV